MSRSPFDGRMFDALLASFSDNLYVFDADLRYAFATPTAASAIGLAPADLVGRTWKELGLPAAVMEPVEQQVRATFANGDRVRAETLFAGPHGPRYYEYIMNPIGSQPVAFVSVVGRDITDRKLAEQKLLEARALERSSEERLRIALDAGRMGTWEWDVARNLVHWSSTLERLHGIPEGSFEGTFDAYQRDIHPEDRERVLQIIQTTLKQRQEHHLEYRIVLPNGDVRWLEANGRVICDTSGKPTRVVGVCMDVTSRHQADEAREQFLGILGHDLRNPLNTIFMGSAMLLKKGSLPEHEIQTVAKIARSADRMERMIANLLDFARGRLGGGIPVTLESVAMDEVCDRVIEELELAHPGRSIVFRKDGDLRGHWDPGRLAQAVSNLIANAIKHGQDPITVSVREADGSVLMEINNQGPPIPQAVLATLFHPFKSGQEKNEDGLGLGLYIVSEIVRAHGGSIDARSTSSEGTTFVVSWPRSFDPSTQVTGPRPQPTSVTGPSTNGSSN